MTNILNHSLQIPLQRLPHSVGLDLPRYATKDAAACDLMAAIEVPLTLNPGARALIPTGIAMAIPAGFEAQVRPRSGLALKHGITVLNAPGTIDADYRGEIGIIIANLGENLFIVERGMRIAQLLIAPVTRAAWVEVNALEATDRGARGFGSTGTQTHSHKS
ncbi:MAG: dUTP diphosphatase [Alphaproteobacteria bacterium]